MSTAWPSPELPGVGAVVADKYRIEGLLGRGAMGVVFAASHVVTGAPVALKWLSSCGHDVDQRARLFREARAAGRVVHPNVVKVHDVGQHDGAVFLVMERLVGRSLGDAMEAREPLTPGDAVRLMMPALRAVTAAHAAGVIHRDLKPDNLFLAEDGAGHTTLKVLDFGISKLDEGPQELTLTQTGVVLGTPLYMAPEQLRGMKELDGRCDQYALACILYELVEGVAPHEGDSYAELAASKLKSTPRPFSASVPVAFSQAVMRALATSPKARFADLASFAEALEAVADGARFSDDVDVSGLFRSVATVPPREAQEGSTTLVARWPIRRRPRWLVGVAALVVVAGVALGWSLRPAPSTNTGVARSLAPSSASVTSAEAPAAVDEPETVSGEAGGSRHRGIAMDGAVIRARSQRAPEGAGAALEEGDAFEAGDALDDEETASSSRPRRGASAVRPRHRTGRLRIGDF